VHRPNEQRMPQHTNIACGHNGKILLCDVFALFSTWSAAVFLPGVLEELRAASPVQDMQHVASAMQNIEQAAPAHRRGGAPAAPRAGASDGQGSADTAAAAGLLHGLSQLGASAGSQPGEISMGTSNDGDEFVQRLSVRTLTDGAYAQLQGDGDEEFSDMPRSIVASVAALHSATGTAKGVHVTVQEVYDKARANWINSS
jgi:hypothetical protein